MVTKDVHEKRPCGKPPAGAVLVDGRWQLTELSAQIAADRLLREREQRRNRRREMRKLLRQSHPDLFVFARKQDPQQTTLTPEPAETRVPPRFAKSRGNARDICSAQAP